MTVLRRRLIASSLLAAVLSCASFRSQAPADAAARPSVEEILSRYEEAIGGRAAWMKLTSRVSKGTIQIPSMENQGSVESYEKAPNKTLSIVTIGGAVYEQGFDGRVAWARDPRGAVRELSGADFEDAKRNAVFAQPLKLRTLFPKMSLIGSDSASGGDSYVIEATPSRGKPQKMYFDSKTGLLVRQVIWHTTSDGDQAIDDVLEDYSSIDGVKVPLTVQQRTGQSTLVIHLTEVKHNVEIADTKFAKPAR